MRIVPFVRRESGHTVDGEGDEDVGGEHVQPNVDGQGGEEREEARRRRGGHLEQDADAEIHERFGEVDDGLARIVDGHRADGEVSFLCVTGKK